jgi:hypothetical protein
MKIFGKPSDNDLLPEEREVNKQRSKYIDPINIERFGVDDSAVNELLLKVNNLIASMNHLWDIYYELLELVRQYGEE